MSVDVNEATETSSPARYLKLDPVSQGPI